MQTEYTKPDHTLNVFLDPTELETSEKARSSFIESIGNSVFNYRGIWLVGAGRTTTSKWLSFEYTSSVGVNTLVITHPEGIESWTADDIREHSAELTVKIIGKAFNVTNEIADISYDGTLKTFFKDRNEYTTFSRVDRLLWAFLLHPIPITRWLTGNHVLKFLNMKMTSYVVEETIHVGALGFCLYPVAEHLKQAALVTDIDDKPISVFLTDETVDEGVVQILHDGWCVKDTPLGIGKMIDEAIAIYHEKVKTNYSDIDQTYIGFDSYLGLFSALNAETNPVYQLGTLFEECRKDTAASH